MRRTYVGKTSDTLADFGRINRADGDLLICLFLPPGNGGLDVESTFDEHGYSR